MRSLKLICAAGLVLGLLAGTAAAEPFIPDMGPSEGGMADDTGAAAEQGMAGDPGMAGDQGMTADQGSTSEDGAVSADSGTTKKDDDDGGCSISRHPSASAGALVLLGLALLPLFRRRRD